VTTLREALQAEGMLDRELEFYSTIEAKNELLTEEVNRLRVVNAELSADRARLEREVQEANNTASAAWATADQLKDEIAKLRNTSATWATPEERTNLIKDRDWWRETAQKNVLTIEQLRGEIANLRKANSSFADAFTLRPALIQATVLVLAYEAGHRWDETAKDFIVEHSGADWLAEAQTQFERNLGADDEMPHRKVLHGQCPVCQHYGSDCTGTDEEEPTPEEQRTVAQLTRKPRLQQLAERLVVVEMTKADTRAVQQLSHGLAALMEKVNALMPPDVQGTIRQIDKAMNAEVYERLARLEQRVVNHEDRIKRIDAVQEEVEFRVLPPLQEKVRELEDAVGGTSESLNSRCDEIYTRFKKLETSVAELSLSPVIGAGMSGQPVR
jgi:hypothetical protein